MEKIEILGLNIFNTLKYEMDIVERIQKYFNQGIGWSYYLDLAWIVHEIKRLPRSSLILDAGAGIGLAQFILSELGYNIISADFANRPFSQLVLKRYGSIIHYLNDQSIVFDTDYTRHLENTYDLKIGGRKSGFFKRLFSWKLKVKSSDSEREEAKAMISKNKLSVKIESNDILKENVNSYCGRIFIYKCHLKQMSLLPDNFVDGVVSVSAIEHNTPEEAEMCISEILRVTKPNGLLAMTAHASQGEDWFHEPSKGWCYSETSLKKLFRLSNDVQSNFSEKDILFEQLKKKGNELHRRLAPFYFQSGNNGMPWGVWNPQYQPVGILKIKS